ncbi:dehydrogenase [Rhizobium sp. Root564]|nr:dehydrogenase [Rhizobium sp. Root564]
MRPTRKETAADPVAHRVAWHDGDHRAAIETLMQDVRHLREQLALATAAMSAGYMKGWTPKEVRGDS